MRSIDIHPHLTRQCFWRATEGAGDWHTMRREQDAPDREILVAGDRRGPLPPKANWTPEQRLDDMDSLGVGGVHRLGAVHGQASDAIVTLHHEVLALGMWVRLLLAGQECCSGPCDCRNR